MSILELKQEVCRLSKRDQQELSAYLLRLKHETPEWRRTTARRLREMKSGKRVTAEALEALLAYG